MNITIHSRAIGSQHTQTVNARELHGFLDVQTRYNDWIKNRIEQYGFGEGTDFLTLTENLVSGGTQKTHHVTVDMAKELASVWCTTRASPNDVAKGYPCRNRCVNSEQSVA